MSATPRSGCITLRSSAGCLGHDELQRREHLALDEVPAARRPIGQAEDHVDIQAGTVLVLGHVTDQ